MRIDIEIDEKLLQQAMLASGAETPSRAIGLGLELLIELQQAQTPVRALKGQVTWEDAAAASKPDR